MKRALKELAKHSAVYGLGSVVARVLAVLLLPLYTRYLTPHDYGLIETLIALSAVTMTIAHAGMKSAFFRFYFDSNDAEHRRRVLRTAFWFTMASATGFALAGILLADEVSQLLFATRDHDGLVAAAFVGMWASLNYEQMTSLFRVEQRSTAYLAATLANVAITIAATVVLVVVLERGPLGVIVGSFTGTLVVYAALLAYRHDQLGLQFDRTLFREMNRFGLPLVPAALALWLTNFSDRLFLVKLADPEEVGLYSVGVRLASAILLLVTAFGTAWPAFAYSIGDDREARRTYSFVLTYVLLAASWAALALAALAPWLVRLLTTPEFHDAARVVGPLAFATALFAGYVVVQIGVGRARRTQLNWVVTGAAAGVNVALNIVLIPPLGMMGAAAATFAAYGVLFAGMSVRAQRVYPVPYQWRRVFTLLGAAAALAVVAAALDPPLALAILLAASYPLVLLALGFYFPQERRAVTAAMRYPTTR